MAAIDIPEDYDLVYYLVKGRALTLNMRNQGQKTFAPSALIQKSYSEGPKGILAKQMTIGGCCGKPSKTVYLFATEEQLASGEREWIG